METKIMIAIAAAIFVALILLFFLNRKPAKSGKTIYGKMACPYTVKQVDKYPDATFVDCSVPGACPDFVTAFPTTKHEDGSIVVGFK